MILRWCEIEEIMQKSCYGPQIGIDIYTCNKKHYSFNLLKPESTVRFVKFLEDKKKEDQSFELIKDPVKVFEKNGFADAWKSGEKSN